MPKIPDGAKTPDDRKPSQVGLVKPDEHPDGWELLRDPMDIEYWEEADLVSTLAAVKTRGERVALTASNLKAIGAVAQLLQVVFAVDSNAFRTWVKESGSFEAATMKLLPLVYAYANALGEADSSAS